jgi:uncharacterized membrane protein (DUF2068 family)
MKPGWWRRLRSWAAWEFGRRIELTVGLRLIAVERFVKATVLGGGGVALLVLGARGQVTMLLLRIQAEYALEPARGLWERLVHLVFGLILRLPGNRIVDLAVAGLAYAALEATEGVGLVLRRRWAEYLVLVATLAFLPLEIDELHRRLTAFRVLALLVNLGIAGYLVWRKRLFLERRPATE